MTRPIESSEETVACPECRAAPGGRCTSLLNGERRVTVRAHVERIRAHGRERRIAVVVRALRGLGITGRALAEKIVDDLAVLNRREKL